MPAELKLGGELSIYVGEAVYAVHIPIRKFAFRRQRNCIVDEQIILNLWDGDLNLVLRRNGTGSLLKRGDAIAGSYYLISNFVYPKEELPLYDGPVAAGLAVFEGGAFPALPILMTSCVANGPRVIFSDDAKGSLLMFLGADAGNREYLMRVAANRGNLCPILIYDSKEKVLRVDGEKSERALLKGELHCERR